MTCLLVILKGNNYNENQHTLQNHSFVITINLYGNFTYIDYNEI